MSDERPSDRLRETLPFIRRDHNEHLPNLIAEVLAEVDGLRRRERHLVTDRDMEAASFRRLADAVAFNLATDDDDDDQGDRPRPAERAPRTRARRHVVGGRRTGRGGSVNADLVSAVDKLMRYGTARDRDRDPELRDVTLTDDEAVALLDALQASAR